MNNVLIVIDMINDFMDSDGALFVGDHSLKIVPEIRKLVKLEHLNERPVVFVKDSHTPNDKEFARFPKHALALSWGARIIKGIDYNLENDLTIYKNRYNAFFGTNLETNLNSLDVSPEKTTVTVVGVCTDICVMDTVGWLANMDYNIVVPENCVASFDAEGHKYALKRMKTLYGVKINE